MPQSSMGFVSRVQMFMRNLNAIEWKKIRSLALFLGWLATFVLIVSPFYLFRVLDVWLYIVHLFLWTLLVKKLSIKLQPPAEFLSAILLILFLFESWLLHVSGASPGRLAATGQLIILAFLVLCFSLILVKKCHRPRVVMLTTFLVFYICLNILKEGGSISSFIVQALLFIVLLRHTTWLEELTKLECWVSFLLFFIAFKFIGHLQPKAVSNDAVFMWVQFPLLLYYLFKMYLLAVLIKIPIVLVYNFASLSRKLNISGYFQSTFPQIIQMVMLLIIFYFFIAGWQAEKVRMALMSEMERISAENTSQGVQHFKVSKTSPHATFKISGYEPIHFHRDFSSKGVLVVKPIGKNLSGSKPVKQYFIYSTISEGDEELISFIKIDSSFMTHVSQNTSILAGTHLLTYPYTPTKFESFFYDLNFLGSRKNFRIFPFGLLPRNDSLSTNVPIRQVQYSTSEWANRINIDITRKARFTIGRVITPLRNANMNSIGYFVFDILMYPNLTNFTPTLLGYVALLILVYLGVNFFVIRRMVKFGSEINHMIVQKFNQLKNGIREISSGNLDYKVTLEGKDEFVELAEHFNQMGDKLKESIAEAREKERLEHELTIARKVQLDLLPRSLPRIPGYNIAAMFKTATEVGGDFYDIIRLDEDLYLFTIGDVSGKGTSAAFYMAQCISLIRYSPQFTTDPKEIVLRLNKYFSDPLVDLQVFVTAIVGTIDIKKHHIAFVRAGHNLPVLVPGKRSKKIRELKQSGLGLGLERGGRLFENSLEVTRLDLENNDKILFYTDGFVEASKANGALETTEYREREFYGEERLLHKLEENRNKNATEMMQVLQKDIDTFYGDRSPVDDYTVLLIQKSTK